MTASPRNRLRAAVTVALLSLVGAGPAALAAKPAAANHLPALAAKTTIRGGHTASVRVHIPRSANLAFDSTTSRSPAVKVSGAGRFVGVVLMRVGTTATSGQWFAQTRVTGCGAPNCVPGAGGSSDPIDGEEIAGYTGFPETSGQSEFHQLHFPAGDYQLTLIADSAPVAVTLTLSGLTGATTLTPHAPTEATTKSIPPSLLPTPQAATVLSAGGQAMVSSQLGVLAYAISFKFSVRGGDASNWCLYNGSRPAPDGEYLPGCPGDDAILSLPGFVILQQGVNVPSGQYGIAFVQGRQVWGQGLWSAGASIVEESHPASFLWLSTTS